MVFLHHPICAMICYIIRSHSVYEEIVGYGCRDKNGLGGDAIAPGVCVVANLGGSVGVVPHIFVSLSERIRILPDSHNHAHFRPVMLLRLRPDVCNYPRRVLPLLNCLNQNSSVYIVPLNVDRTMDVYRPDCYCIVSMGYTYRV